MTSSPALNPGPARLEVLCAVALRTAMNQLVRMYENEMLTTVSIDFDFNPAVARRIEHGESFDVAVTNPHLLNELARQGHIDPTTRVTIGRSPLGLAAHREHGPVDVSSLVALEHTLRAARTIGYAPEGTSGKRLLAILDRMGLVDAVRDKLRPMPGGYAGLAVAAREVEVGIVPVSTILAAAPDAVLAGTLPAELDIQIEFEAALASTPRDADLARSFLHALAAPRIDALLSANGIERIAGRSPGSVERT